jgi:signal transduction histidine kinase
MRRWVTRRLGVRLRSAFAAVLVVAVVLAVAAGAFLLLHRQSLVAIVDAAASDRAAALADRVAAQDRAGMDRLLLTPPGESTVIQVVRPDGTVTAFSANARGERAISSLRPPAGEVQRQDRLLPGLGDDPFRIIATGVLTPAGPQVVLVARSLAPVAESTETEVALIVVGYPLLLLAVGAATALFVGRSLRAVEAVRGQVAGITARHLHERVPVPHARDEVWRLASTMNEMLDRLEAASAAQRRFVADASHELRSPLTTLRVGLELQANRPENAPLLEEVGRLQGLVDDLLLLARVDESGLAPRYTDVDLDDIVDTERRRIATRADLTVETAVAPVRLRGDHRQLGRALRNLVDNAARHASSTVELSVWQDTAGAHAQVANDGPPIPADQRERIFDRFVRLDESRQRGGSGLGLAIVREIAEGHRGTVEVVDTVDGRTAFRLTLPLRQPPAPADKAARAPVDKAARAPADKAARAQEKAARADGDKAGRADDGREVSRW